MLTLKYLAQDGTTTITGKSTTLADDSKTKNAIDLVCEMQLGAEVVDAMKREEKADFAAEWAAKALQRLARQYRNAKAARLAEEAEAAKDDL